MLKWVMTSAAAIALAGCGSKVGEPDSGALIQTPQGPVQGVSTEDAGIYNFKGLPFAAPPVDGLRWAAPAPAPTWSETRVADSFGNRCLQPQDVEGGFMERLIDGHGLSGMKSWAIKRIVAGMEPGPMSEDCLYLNVRTANLKGTTKHPVMLWIHGGGHQFGSADFDTYQANGLARKGVVLVTTNYRLGAFGYMAHPALSADDPNGVSGNYGTLDQIAALKWVRDNIESYGGDPDNITIFGESAGGWSVTELMASPLAEGLFHKAIAQSGASTYHMSQIKGEGVGWPSGYATGKRVADALELNNPTAADLRAVSAEDLMAKLPPLADEGFHHIRDGYVFPENVGVAFRTGRINAVPFITGYNADEGTLFFPDDQQPSVWEADMPREVDAMRAALETHYPGHGQTLIDLYDLDTDFETGGTQMMGDEIFGVNIRMAARANSAPTWVYHFSRVPPSKNQFVGAFHAAEIPFVFDSQEPALGYSKEDERLTEIMTTAWTNFAKTGNPEGGVVTDWPEYDGQNWLHLSANTGRPVIQVETDLRDRKLNALEVGLTQKLDELQTVQAAE